MNSEQLATRFSQAMTQEFGVPIRRGNFLGWGQNGNDGLDVVVESKNQRSTKVVVSLFGNPEEYRRAGLAGLRLRDGRTGWSRIDLVDGSDVEVALSFARLAFTLRRRRAA